MKQKKLKKAVLKKETVANLNSLDLAKAVGGVSATISTECCVNPGGGGDPIDIPGIDIPTFNDSCFSLCDDKCNDF